MHKDQATIFENGIRFDVISRPSIDNATVVATFEDGNSERHKVALNGIDLKNVIEQLQQCINGENIPSVDKVHLYMNPSNPIYLVVNDKGSGQFFTPPLTVSPFTNTTPPSFR